MGETMSTETTADAATPADTDGRLGVAVVGGGYWGPNLVRNFQASDSFALRYMCDLQIERARRALGRYSTVAATDDYAEVLADPRVAAVAIATPAATHRDLALAALRAGKHVLVEKPLAASYAEGRELVEVAAERGLTLMCDHTYCYTPAVSYIRDLIASGELGDVHFLDSVRINLGLVQPDVDVLWDLAPHDLSILDFILPPGMEPLSVSAHGADPIGAGRACVGPHARVLRGGECGGIDIGDEHAGPAGCEAVGHDAADAVGAGGDRDADAAEVDGERGTGAFGHGAVSLPGCPLIGAGRDAGNAAPPAVPTRVRRVRSGGRWDYRTVLTICR